MNTSKKDPPKKYPPKKYPSKKDDVSFGFKDVNASEKSTLVKNIFESVAGNYDLMNDFMSLGIHRLWKDTLIHTLKPKNNMTLLDVAGGTGDVAFRFVNAGGKHVTVCDLTEGMVRVGRDRATDRGLLNGIDWVVGDALTLPMANNSVDAYTIAFGLRNVTYINQALAEAHRVLKPGGRFLCLEFSHVVLPVLDKLYDTYSFNILPKLGAWIAKDQDSYVYLVESIRRFPKQDDLLTMMADSGFVHNDYKNLTGGIAAIHSGWKV